MISPRFFFSGFRNSFAASVLGISALSCVVVPAALHSSASAQEFRGTISGAVTDPSGAVVPGASVLVRESSTGTTYNSKSDAAGQYVVPFLLPGTYTISITMPGFQTATRAGVTLQSQEHPIINLALTVGETSQTVTVNSDAPLVDQANASVGQVISSESVANLPVNGRTPTTLTELSVGVIAVTPPQIVHPFDNAAGNSFSLGGTPNQTSEVLLDGSPDLTILGALAYAPTQDSVQEVSVRPFDTDASFGHTIGGVVNQITRSGTNRIHGTLYEFYQTAGLDANLYFNKRSTPIASRPNAHFHQYGGTIGGPIVIPKLYDGKDKAFFFFAYEGLKDSTPFTAQTTVPTSAERNGDFSQTLAAGCPGGFANNPATAAAICLPSGKNTTNYADPNQLYNPATSVGTTSNFTRTPYLNNQLPTGSFSPVALAYLKLFPQPNTTTGVASDGQGNYIANAPSIDTYSNQFGRVDFNPGQRDHIFADFRHNHRTQVKNDYFGNGATGSNLLRENFGLTIDNVFTLSPSTILDTRVNWTLFNEVSGTPASRYTPNSVGLPGALTSASEAAQLPFINFAYTSGTSCTSYSSFQCFGDTGSGFDPTTSYQVFADVVKIAGRHTLKLGFDGRQYRLSVQQFGNSSGNFTFNSSFVNSGTTGSSSVFGGDLAAFLLGLPSSGGYDLQARADYHNYYIGSFLQDDYRFNDKLTFNFGIRFDIDTPFGEKNGRTVSGFNPTAVNSLTGPAAGKFTPKTVSSGGQSYTLSTLNTLGGLTFPGANRAPYNTNSGFFSPRFGFSYAPQNKLVIRGGFGIFVQPESLSNIASTGKTSSAAVNNQEGFSATTSYVANNGSFFAPANSLNNPFPNGFSQPAGSSAGASTFLGQSISFLAPNEHDPYSERYNVGAQYSLTNSTLVEALYVGNHSLHLPIASQNLNATALPFLTTAPYRNQNLSNAYASSVANPYAGLLSNSNGCNGGTTTFANLVVPFPQFCNASVNIQNNTIGQSYFNSAILHVEQRSKHGLTVTANYSFSKLIEADTFLNDQDASPTRRVSPFDHTHHFTVGSTYNLPFGKGKAFSFGGNRIADAVLGGFVVNAIYQFESGAPVLFTSDIPLAPGATIRSITDQARNTSPVPATGATGNPALSVNQFVTGSLTACPKDMNGNTIPCDLSGQTFFNGQYTNHLRTLPQTISTVRQDGFNNLDASLLKNFNFTEKTYLQIRFETFNTLNHAVFSAPNVSSATASNFGYITAVAANSQPRQIQLGGRFVF